MDRNKVTDDNILEYSMTWNPIETAPTDGTEIVVLDGGAVRTAVWSDMIGKFTGRGGNVFNWCENPTHWMPLPAPPTTDVEVE